MLTRMKQVAPYLVLMAGGFALFAMADRIVFTAIPDQIGPDVWPKLILVLLIGVCAIAILQKLVLRNDAAKPGGLLHVEDAEDFAADHGEQRPWLVFGVLAATVIYLFVLETVGFFLGTIVFAGVLMWFGGFRKPLWIAGLAGGFALLFTFIFMKVVFVALPIGTGPFAKVSLAVMALLGIH